MAEKESGMGWTTCSVDDGGGSLVVIVNDVTNLTLATTRGEQDITGLDKTAHERLLLLADASITLNGVFDDDAAGSHLVFKTVVSTDQLRTTSLAISGQTFVPELFYNDYTLTRGADGSFTFSATGATGDGAATAWS